MNRIIVVNHDPRWPDLYAEAAGGLREAFGASLVALEHVGNTSVPGLAAKSILDIHAVVRALPDVEAATPALGVLGWEQGVFLLDPERHL